MFINIYRKKNQTRIRKSARNEFHLHELNAKNAGIDKHSPNLNIRFSISKISIRTQPKSKKQKTQIAPSELFIIIIIIIYHINVNVTMSRMKFV